MYLLKILVSTFDYKSKEIILNFEISVQLIQSLFEIVALHKLQQLSQVFDVFQSSRVQMIREAHCVNQKRQLSHQVREFVVHDELRASYQRRNRLIKVDNVQMSTTKQEAASQMFRRRSLTLSNVLTLLARLWVGDGRTKIAIRFRGRDNHFFSKENVRDNVKVLKPFN